MDPESDRDLYKGSVNPLGALRGRKRKITSNKEEVVEKQSNPDDKSQKLQGAR